MKTKSLFIYTLASLILSLSVVGKVLSQESEVEPISITPKVTVDDVLSAGAEKIQNAKASQITVDRIADQTDSLLQEFKQVNKQIENLRVYNSQLERQIASQKRIMEELKESISTTELSTLPPPDAASLFVAMFGCFSGAPVRGLYPG